MKRYLFIVCLILGYVPLAHADWRWIGPAAGSIEELTPDRSNPDVWFAVNNGSLYLSTDGGRTWNTTGLRKVGYQGATYYRGSSVSETAGSRIVVLKQGKGKNSTDIWASQDHGKTFQQVSSVPFVLTRVISSSDDPRLLYGAASYKWGIVVSRDGGVHWTAFNNLPLPQHQHPGCSVPYADGVDVAVSPLHPDTIYVSGSLLFQCGPESDDESFFMQSTDAGKSWKPAIPGTWVHFDVDAAYPGRLYAHNNNQLLILTRQGWQEISKQQDLQKMFSVPRHENELLALESAVYNRALRSTDAGRTWHDLNLDLHNKVGTLGTRDDNSRGLLGGTDGGGLYFRDEKQGWIPVSNGFRDSVNLDVQGTSMSLYTLLKGEFLYAQQQGSWKDLTFGIPGTTPFALAVDPANANHVVVLSTGIEVSKDGGKSWRQAKLDGSYNNIGRTVTIDPAHSNIVYAGKGNSYGLFKSTDGGASFKTLSPKFTSRGYADIARIVVDPNDGRIVYFVVPFFGIYKSTNGGASVALAVNGIAPPCPQCESNPAIDLVPLATKDTYLAITMQGKLYRTTDGAQQWTLIGQGPARSWVSRLYTADGMGQHLYCLAGQSPKLYESLNAGQTWKNLTPQFGPQSEVYSITDPKMLPLFAGTNHGVFVQQ